jgi:hypothetical protein
MANPNIINVSDIRGNTAVQNVTTVSTALVTNSASSNSLYKIVMLSVSNISNADSVGITVTLERNSINYAIANNITVPINASIVIISKEAAIYLIEGDKLNCTSSSNSTAQIVCSYEVIQ